MYTGSCFSILKCQNIKINIKPLKRSQNKKNAYEENQVTASLIYDGWLLSLNLLFLMVAKILPLCCPSHNDQI